MNAETIKLQVTVTRELAHALQLAAAKDRRTRPTFIIKLLEDSSLVKEALVLARETPLNPSGPLVENRKLPPLPKAPEPAPAPAEQVWTPGYVARPGLRGYKEYLASGGSKDDCTTKDTGILRIDDTGEELDETR